jgi:hypothetical protein
MNLPTNNPRREAFSIKDDGARMADPTGTGLIGRSSGIDLSKSALGHPVILYRAKDGQDVLLTADVYALPDQPLSVHVYCPLCKNHLTIRQDNKAIDYDRNAPVSIPGYSTAWLLAELNVADLGGRLSIEPFRCTWEEQPDLRRSYGFGVCGWSVAIDGNVARHV